ncbi:HNH endonuclease signature motif containing protein [Blastococcus mobilis]|uniref:HNH endonuclease n=1 Tax=Blastococcus mobilis TaxID=1938746 RepID=A0A238VWK7_9ACTN|nr:HNH endonuclease signature motif containing protein [Blastococcus mobilis]SNR38213.1 HNH endonuclease [Blastococcus mobilis]
MSIFSPSEHRSGSSLPDLAAAITAGAVRIAAATAAWLRLIAEFDEREGWHGYGIASCAHWLSWQCGLSPGAAREHVRVARALGGLPLIEAAFANGRLSYSKVRALTRIAEPDSEAALLELAVELTASQVERTVRQWRRAEGANAGEPPPEGRQSFEHWWDESGMLTVQVRMPPEAGAGFMAAIDSLAEREARRERAQANRDDRGKAGPGTAPGSPVRDNMSARRLTALTRLAEVAVDSDRRPGDPPRREVVVHVDAAVLADDGAAGRAYLEGGPALPPALTRRMLCEASVVAMLEQDREPLAVGRRKRRATRAQRMALLRRDGGCARPGCPEGRIERLHAHHLQHWLFGGRTDLTNLVLLCDRDHGLVHELDLVMSRAGGRLVVTTPDGRRVWGTADAGFTGALAGLDATSAADQDAFAGVHPIDTVVGRRPHAQAIVLEPAERQPAERCLPATGDRRRRGARPARTPAGPAPGGRTATSPHLSRHRSHRKGTRHPGSSTPRPPITRTDAAIAATLFPTGEPALPDAMPAGGERMDVRHVVGVLMGNRDLVRRLAAEAAAVPAGTP